MIQTLEKNEFEKLAESLQCVTERDKGEAVKELIQGEKCQMLRDKMEKLFC